jgi:hypothetical protein
MQGNACIKDADLVIVARGADKEDRAAAARSERLIKVRFAAHYGLNSDIVLRSKSALAQYRKWP